MIRKNPNVLVLLAAFNGSRWIRAQINSILDQTGVHVDLCVGDDGSSDGTLEQIRPLLEAGKIRLDCNPRPSGSAAQNFLRMIRANPVAEYDYIAFADQDDIWRPLKLARACEALREPNQAGYSCAVTAFWPDGREILLSQARRPTRSDFLFEGAGQGCGFVLRADFYDRLRQFCREHSAQTTELHYHDWATYALSRAWGLPWVFDSWSGVLYRQHAENDTGARSGSGGISKRLALIRDGWYARQITAIAGLCRSAAPSESLITTWQELLASQRDWKRKTRMLQFCMRGGRRRRTDNLVLMAAVAAGWI